MKKNLPITLILCFLCAGCSSDQKNQKNNVVQIREIGPADNLEQILRDDTIPEKTKSALSSGAVRILVSRPNVLMKISVLNVEGSGLVVAGDKVLTCFHVIANNFGNSFYADELYEEIRVIFSGRIYSAKIFAADPQRDLALLRIIDSPGDKFTGKQIVVSPLALDKFPRRPWFALGFVPGGTAFLKEYHHFEGYFVNPRVAASTSLKGGFDEPMDPGLSGSPIVDSEGECRGIVEMTSNAGTVFIPASDILEFLQSVPK